MADKQGLIINTEFNPAIVSIILRRHWLTPVLFITFFSLGAFIYLRYTKPIYQSTCILQIIEEDRTGQVLGNESDNNIINTETDISKEIELLRSDVLFSKAINKIPLQTSIFLEGKVVTRDLYGFAPFEIQIFEFKDSSLCNKRIDLNYEGSKLKLTMQLGSKPKTYFITPNKHLKTKDFDIVLRIIESKNFSKIIGENHVFFQFNNLQSLAKELHSNLIINPVDEKAKTIEISFTHFNPRLCYDVVNAVLDAYMGYDKEGKQTKALKTIAFIDEQLDSLSKVLQISKDSLNIFTRREKIPDPETYGSSLSDNLNQLYDKVAEIDDEITTLKLVSSKISSNPNRIELYKLIPEMMGMKSMEEGLMSLIEELNKLLETRDDLLRDVTPESPKIISLNEKIQSRVTTIRKSISTIDERLKNSRNLVQDRISMLESKYFNLPEKKMEYERLKYLEDLNNRYFSLFTEKKIEFELSAAGYSTTNRILTEAVVPLSPLRPNQSIVYLICAFLGILFGGGILVFRYVTFNDIINAPDLQKLLPEKANFLGAVPLYKKKMRYSQVVVNESSKSRMAEAIRSIRANMSFINKDAKVIAVSSSISGEGKTFVVLNMAGLIAANGKKTVVIDLDLRKPKIHHGFNTENYDGMSNLISGFVNIDDVVRTSHIQNLFYITAGPIPPNPSELIQSARLQEILEDLKTKFDVIMIDNPPVGIVSDGIQILANADIPLYVFKANYSKRMFVNRVEELFEVQKLKNLNIILNGVETKRSVYGYGDGYGYGYGYGYGSGYGYGYGYGYGESNGEAGYYTDDELEKPLMAKVIDQLRSLWKSRKKKSQD